MKKIIYIGSLLLLLLVACNDNMENKNVEKEKIETSTETSTDSNDNYEEIKKEETNTDETKKDDTIDTSVFENVKSIEVIDSRSTTKHITLKIDLFDDVEAGMSTLNILSQMFDFIQQEDIQGAETITYLIRSNDLMLAQFTTNISEFKPNDTEGMASLVLKASKIDKMNNEVKSFGEAMGLW